MRSVAFGAALLALALAGCGTPAADGPTFRLGGAFTEQRTDADLQDFQRTVRPYSDDVLLMESFPEQFSIRGIVGGCEQLRSQLDAKPYIATVGQCSPEAS